LHAPRERLLRCNVLIVHDIDNNAWRRCLTRCLAFRAVRPGCGHCQECNDGSDSWLRCHSEWLLTGDEWLRDIPSASATIHSMQRTDRPDVGLFRMAERPIPYVALAQL